MWNRPIGTAERHTIYNTAQTAFRRSTSRSGFVVAQHRYMEIIERRYISGITLGTSNNILCCCVFKKNTLFIFYVRVQEFFDSTFAINFIAKIQSILIFT